MHAFAESSPSPAAPNFAALLTALAEPEHDSAQEENSAGGRLSSPGRRSASAWSDDGLEDDVATLSYEYALKAHARYRAPDQLLIPLAEAGIVPAAAVPVPVAKRLHAEHPQTEARGLRTALARNLKDASITIRMSKAECAQLQKRAAEAGLSVSAYLRSCTVEAESLRAMVKETLEQLRAATNEEKPAGLRPSRLGRWSGELGRLLTPWRNSQRVARA
jgi:hypothetical protein